MPQMGFDPETSHTALLTELTVLQSNTVYKGQPHIPQFMNNAYNLNQYIQGNCS